MTDTAAAAYVRVMKALAALAVPGLIPNLPVEHVRRQVATLHARHWQPESIAAVTTAGIATARQPAAVFVAALNELVADDVPSPDWDPTPEPPSTWAGPGPRLDPERVAAHAAACRAALAGRDVAERAQRRRDHDPYPSANPDEIGAPSPVYGPSEGMSGGDDPE